MAPCVQAQERMQRTAGRRGHAHLDRWAQDRPERDVVILRVQGGLAFAMTVVQCECCGCSTPWLVGSQKRAHGCQGKGSNQDKPWIEDL